MVDARPEFSEGRAMVGVRVTDNGVGIPPDVLPRIFERGFSTKSRSSSGLGLHWCAVTATALGGQLQAESAGRGLGACLRLLLPQAELQPAPPVAATTGG
jgi:signal transduction histidine kinase